MASSKDWPQVDISKTKVHKITPPEVKVVLGFFGITESNIVVDRGIWQDYMESQPERYDQ